MKLGVPLSVGPGQSHDLFIDNKVLCRWTDCLDANCKRGYKMYPT